MSQPDEAGVGSESYEPESRGCLIIVASYADLTRTVAPIAAEAARRISISPTLGDFAELRYASLGHRPYAEYERGVAVSRMAEEITRPTAPSMLNYFAVVIVDRSAAAAEHILADCLAHSVFAALPLRYAGLAAIDERRASAGASGGSDQKLAANQLSMRIVLPRDGTWTRRGMIDALRRYAEDMLLDFGTGHEPGVTQEQLNLLRQEALPAPAGPGEEHTDADTELDLLPEVPEPEIAEQAAPGASPDTQDAYRDEVVPLRPEPAAAPAPPGPADDAPRSAPLELPVPPQLPAAPVPPRDTPPAPERNLPTLEAAAHPAAAHPPAAYPPAALLPAARTLTSRRRVIAQRSPLKTPSARPRHPTAVLYVAHVGGASDRKAWQRGRALLLEVDAALAAVADPAWQVRFAPDLVSFRDSVLKTAGRLSRRDFRRPHSRPDVARGLAAMRAALTRDLATVERSAGPARAVAVLIFAVEAPLADAITTEEYERLATVATIIWVVPEPALDLLSPAFAASGQVLADHPDAAGEIVIALSRGPWLAAGYLSRTAQAAC